MIDTVEKNGQKNLSELDNLICDSDDSASEMDDFDFQGKSKKTCREESGVYKDPEVADNNQGRNIKVEHIPATVTEQTPIYISSDEEMPNRFNELANASDSDDSDDEIFDIM